MKKQALCLLLAALLALSGCSAMLEQTYTQVEPADERLFVGEDPSVIEVETKSDLTTAILALVRQGVDRGVIRLMNYRGDVETDLADACLEVAQEDPLGAYAVESIQHDCSHIISYYEANIYIDYRRTHQQVSGVLRVTGSGAIRSSVKSALAAFSPEAVLLVSYFAEDVDSIKALIDQAYYESPATALGKPAVSVKLYPDQTAGYRRLVEIGLSYAEAPETLRTKSAQLEEQSELLFAPLLLLPGDESLTTAFTSLRELVSFLPSGSTAWHALVQRGADSEGFALTAALLCLRLQRECLVVSGTLAGEPHFWNVVRLESGEYRHFDLSSPDGCLLSDAEALELGYTWPREDSSIPPCGRQPPEPTPTPTAEPSPQPTAAPEAGPSDGAEPTAAPTEEPPFDGEEENEENTAGT